MGECSATGNRFSPIDAQGTAMPERTKVFSVTGGRAPGKGIAGGKHPSQSVGGDKKERMNLPRNAV